VDGLVVTVRHAAKPQASWVNLTVLGPLASEQTFWRRICSLLSHRKEGPTLMRNPISSGTGSLLVSMTWLLKSSVPSLICSPPAVPGAALAQVRWLDGAAAVGFSLDSRLAALESALSSRGFAVQRVADMDGWLAYHVAFVACVGAALYRCGTDPSVSPQTARPWRSCARP
jgi:hypothetical protein